MSETKKYELTSETLRYKGCTLHRIKALKDFGPINAGELGGWIESEENLSQANNAWVYGDHSPHGTQVFISETAIEGLPKPYHYKREWGIK